MGKLHDAMMELAELGPTPFPLPLGPLEPVVEGVFTGTNKSDWVLTGPRGLIGATLRGCPVQRLTNSFTGARPYHVAPSSAAPGTRALHAVGLALASNKPVVCLLGLASAASGSFHEALNVAALTGAPVVFVVAVQPVTDDAPVGNQLVAPPSSLAKAMGLKVSKVKCTVAGLAKAIKGARGEPALVEVALPTPE